jgi:hypothetical protein
MATPSTPMSPNRGDRESAKFKETPSGKTAVRVCIDGDTPLPGIEPASVSGPILITGALVTDTSAAFPAVNQVGRVALSIRNIDPVESIWIVNTVGITKAAAGINIWEIGLNETYNIDFDDTNKVILVADAGKTVSIQIQEIKA